MKIAIAQLNPVLGDLAGNVERILDYAERAKQAGATLMAVSYTHLTLPTSDLV